jgi:hypothetical protein
VSHRGPGWRLFQQDALIADAMNALPHRLLNALMPPPGLPHRAVEPRLGLDGQATPVDRRTVEQLLAEGSRRVYTPRQEAEVLDTRRR